jgi:hypothetical protein
MTVTRLADHFYCEPEDESPCAIDGCAEPVVTRVKVTGAPTAMCVRFCHAHAIALVPLPYRKLCDEMRKD